jgi:hypothetical protein
MHSCTCSPAPALLCHMPYAICHTPAPAPCRTRTISLLPPMPYVICHMSYVICHMSYVICHMSYSRTPCCMLCVSPLLSAAVCCCLRVYAICHTAIHPYIPICLYAYIQFRIYIYAVHPYIPICLYAYIQFRIYTPSTYAILAYAYDENLFRIWVYGYGIPHSCSMLYALTWQTRTLGPFHLCPPRR